jgi:hypothetical protein
MMRLPYETGQSIPWDADLAKIEMLILFFSSFWNGQDGFRD